MAVSSTEAPAPMLPWLTQWSSTWRTPSAAVLLVCLLFTLNADAQVRVSGRWLVGLGTYCNDTHLKYTNEIQALANRVLLLRLSQGKYAVVLQQDYLLMQTRALWFSCATRAIRLAATWKVGCRLCYHNISHWSRFKRPGDTSCTL